MSKEKYDTSSTDGNFALEQAREQRKKAEDSRRRSEWLGQDDELNDQALNDYEDYLNSRPISDESKTGLEGIDNDFEPGSTYEVNLDTDREKELDALDHQFGTLEADNAEDLSAGLDLFDEFCDKNKISGKDKARLRVHLLKNMKKAASETKEPSVEKKVVEEDKKNIKDSEEIIEETLNAVDAEDLTVEEKVTESKEEKDEADAAQRILGSDIKDSEKPNMPSGKEKRKPFGELEPARNNIVELELPKFEADKSTILAGEALAKVMYVRSKSTFTPGESSKKSLDKANKDFKDALESEKAKYFEQIDIEDKFVSPNYELVAKMKKFGESLGNDEDRLRLATLYRENPDEYFREMGKRGIYLDEEADKELIEQTKLELREQAKIIINKELEAKINEEKYKVLEAQTAMREAQAEKQSTFTKKFVSKWKKWGTQGKWGKFKKLTLVGAPAFIVGVGGGFASVPLLAGAAATGAGSAIFSTYLSRSLRAKEKTDETIDDVTESAGPKETLDLDRAVDYISEVTKSNRKRLGSVVTTALAAYSFGNLAGNLASGMVQASPGAEATPSGETASSQPAQPVPDGNIPVTPEALINGYVDPGNGFIHELGDILNIPTDQANNLYYDLVNSGSDPSQWLTGAESYNPGPGGQPGLYEGSYQVSDYLKEALRLRGYTI